MSLIIKLSFVEMCEEDSEELFDPHQSSNLIVWLISIQDVL